MIDLALLKRLPKAELHLHIEGSLTPERLFDRAEKHGVTLPYADTAAPSSAPMTSKICRRSLISTTPVATSFVMRRTSTCSPKTILRHVGLRISVRTEIGFDPQAHMERGIPFQVVYEGIHQALMDAEREWGLSHGLTFNLVRHLPEEDALKAIEEAERVGAEILAVGLDSSEAPFPPSLFRRAFDKARALGWRRNRPRGRRRTAELHLVVAEQPQNRAHRSRGAL